MPLADPKIITEFPHSVREIENLWIPLADGCRLAARVWLPESAAPCPAILEYLPYRKRDGTHVRDALTHPYFAAHGYACLRVDMRGNGDSDGLMQDEYLPQEQEDALEIIDWLCQQPWCDGNVGMFGISWGGFNALQVAARQPPALKAIISLCSTDNRFSDDIHYKGGALLMENLGWAATMLSFSSRPPDPALRADWREVWLQRLENLPLLLDTWLSHPRYDDYWKHGSIAEDYAAIRAATLLVGGWHDAYTNSVPRMLAKLSCPRKGVIGPWAHKYPHFAVPGPRIGFLQEALRWWDRWLKNQDTGVEHDPQLRVYVMQSAPPQSRYEFREGEWLGEPQTPFAHAARMRLHLTAQGLHENPNAEDLRDVQSPQDAGTSGGEFCIMWLGPDWPTDQQDDDKRALTFDSNTLDAQMVLLGAPQVMLQLESDEVAGNVIVRLCDVAPDGASTLITFGVLNLAHRAGMETASPMPRGELTSITFALDDCGYRVPEGHRIRVAVATAHWPMIWPAPANPKLRIRGDSWIDLPGYHAARADKITMPEAEGASPARETCLEPPDSYRRVSANAGETRVEILNDFGKWRDESTGLTRRETNYEIHRIKPDDALSARSQIRGTQFLQRDDWQIATETEIQLHCDAKKFYITAALDAHAFGEKVFDKRWRTEVARD